MRSTRSAKSTTSFFSSKSPVKKAGKSQYETMTTTATSAIAKNQAESASLLSNCGQTGKDGKLNDQSILIESLQGQIKALKTKAAVTADLEAQVALLKKQLQASDYSKAQLELALQQEAEQMQEALRQTIFDFQSQLNKKQKQFEELAQKQAITLRELRKEKLVLAATVDQVHDERHAIQKELNRSAKYIKGLEERVLEANQQSLSLLKRVRDLELENDTLKNYIIDLKARVAVYVPIKDDPIDLKVAEFINNYPDRNKLKVMFMRDSEGVYEFGSKRINVRIEKGRILIRVGGGYMSIDEFLDQFTPVELEKLERRDPLKRFSEKVAMTKTMQGHNVSVKQTSPQKRI